MLVLIMPRSARAAQMSWKTPRNLSANFFVPRASTVIFRASKEGATYAKKVFS